MDSLFSMRTNERTRNKIKKNNNELTTHTLGLKMDWLANMLNSWIDTDFGSAPNGPTTTMEYNSTERWIERERETKIDKRTSSEPLPQRIYDVWMVFGWLFDCLAAANGIVHAFTRLHGLQLQLWSLSLLLSLWLSHIQIWAVGAAVEWNEAGLPLNIFPLWFLCVYRYCYQFHLIVKFSFNAWNPGFIRVFSAWETLKKGDFF